jgi:predicted ATPase
MGSVDGTAPRERARRPSSSSLLEREHELETIDAALLAARDGDGRLLFVEAHAGLGKSRLLATAGERAARRGFDVLEAQGSELEREHPFGVARQLLESPVAGACAAEREDLLDGAAAPARPVVEGSVTTTTSAED